MELKVLRHVNRISSEAHKMVFKLVKPGQKEFEMESLLEHYYYSKGGMSHYFIHLHLWIKDVCSEGLNWADRHHRADKLHLEELVKLGILHGNAKDMLKVHLGSVCMPHGLGHLLGLDVHDVGGYPELINEPRLMNLMAHLVQERMVLTVEPGVYFITSLLDQVLSDPAKSCFITNMCWFDSEASEGFRVEENIVVTADGVELLTCVPRTAEEIEAFLADSAKAFSPVVSAE